MSEQLRSLILETASHLRATVELFKVLPDHQRTAHLGVTARRLAMELERAAVESPALAGE